MGAAMAGVEDTASLAAAETEISQDAVRRFDVAFRGGAAVFSILVVLIAWEVFARSGKVTAFMLPPFSAVAERIYADAISGALWRNLSVTMLRALTGFFIAAGGGIALGAAMARNKVVRWFFDPIISVGFPMPKIAFLPIIILWLGVYDVSKICIVVLDAIFPVVTATLAGIAGVDKVLIWSGRNMGASERELMWQIVLPAALPQILTGLQVALPIALIVAIIVALRRFPRRVRRHRRDRDRRLCAHQGDGGHPPTPAGVASGSRRTELGSTFIKTSGKSRRSQRLLSLPSKSR
jgi:ABC-type nitrate/sulfonate/bicarbonate transport system permease component